MLFVCVCLCGCEHADNRCFVSSISAAAPCKVRASFLEMFPAVWRILHREVNKDECNNG